MLGLGAAGFGLAFGPRWLQIGISVALMAIGIYLQGPQAIWNLTNAGSHGGHLAGAAASVGAVAGFLLAAGKKKAKPKRDHVRDLINNILLVKKNLGPRWNDFLKTINDNKNSKISTALVLCQASQESSFLNLLDTGSGFTETTVGFSQEIGLMQIKPDTASSLGVDPTQLTDVATNVTTGTGYLTGLLNQRGSLRTALGVYKQGRTPLSAASRKYADEIIQCTKQLKY